MFVGHLHLSGLLRGLLLADQLAGERRAGGVLGDEVAAEDVALFADEVDASGDRLRAIFDDGVVVDAAPDVGERSAGGSGELVAGDGL